jgi:hypothetical protein
VKFRNRIVLKNIIAMQLFTGLILPTKTFAIQPPDTLWTKTFGGSNIDVGYSVRQTSDSGYVICGYTRSYGVTSGRNVWLIKTDIFGNQVWNNTYGGYNDEEGSSVQQSTDGGYIITGYTKSFGAGLNDVLLIKTNTLGDEVWKKTFGGTQDDEGYSVQQIAGGGYIIAGATSSFGAGSRDVWLIKTDASGNEVWKKTFGGLSSDGARSVYRTMDGGYIITGWTYSQGPGFVGNTLLLKTDSLGNQQWSKAFGGTDADRGYSVQQTTDGGYIITGYTASIGAGLDDLLLIKTDSLGNEVWTKTFGGTGRDYGNSVQQTTDGGYIIAGYTLSYGAGGDDVWLVKTDLNGNEEWTKTYGGIYSDVGYSVEKTIDDGYIITGHTLSYGAGVHDVWLIKVASVIPVELISFTGNFTDGNILLCWTTATEINNLGFEIEKAVFSNSKRDNIKDWEKIASVEGNGTTTEPHQYSFTDKNISPGLYHYRLKQIDYDGSYKYSSVIEVDVTLALDFLLAQNFPNPFNGTSVIKYSIPYSSQVTIKVLDVLGSEIESLVNEEKPTGNYELTWYASDLPSGVYFYRIQAGSFIETKKMVLLR